MKSILLSIKPEYVELIASGEKTIEVRKTRPKLETPFKCYIYCTMGKGVKGDYLKPSDIQCGKVIGEFICDSVYEWKYLTDGFVEEENEKIYYISSKDGHATCLTYDEIENYGKGKTLYGWHISNLKIYDKPEDLCEFRVPCKFAYSSYEQGTCYEDCIQGKLEDCRNFCLPITRPFQSWGYIEYE